MHIGKSAKEIGEMKRSITTIVAIMKEVMHHATVTNIGAGNK